MSHEKLDVWQWSEKVYSFGSKLFEEFEDSENEITIVYAISGEEWNS